MWRFTQGVEVQPYGIDCAFRDPFGNHIRATQPATQPAAATDADRAHWSSPVESRPPLPPRRRSLPRRAWLRSASPTSRRSA